MEDGASLLDTLARSPPDLTTDTVSHAKGSKDQLSKGKQTFQLRVTKECGKYVYIELSIFLIGFVDCFYCVQM